MIDHGIDISKLSLDELKELKNHYESKREEYCQEYLVYAHNCVRDMEIPEKRDYWDKKIKDLEAPTQKYKHLIMDVIRQMEGFEMGAGNMDPGKETVK